MGRHRTLREGFDHPLRGQPLGERESMLRTRREFYGHVRHLPGPYKRQRTTLRPAAARASSEALAERELHPQRVPGAEDAFADDAKFRDYLLNAEHPHGRPKARFFAGLGYDQSNWEALRELFLRELPYVEGRLSRINDAGRENWEAVIPVEGSKKEVPVATYWEVDPGRATRFLTAYPL